MTDWIGSEHRRSSFASLPHLDILPIYTNPAHSSFSTRRSSPLQRFSSQSSFASSKLCPLSQEETSTIQRLGHSFMEMNFDPQHSDLLEVANNNLGLEIAPYDNDITTMPVIQVDNSVDVQGQSSTSSTDNATQLSYFDLASLNEYQSINAQAVDVVRRRSNYFPMSEAMVSPQYHSFTLNQEPAPMLVGNGTKVLESYGAFAQGVIRNHRPGIRRFDSTPRSYRERVEQQSYHESSPESMESYLQSPLTSPVHRITTTTTTTTTNTAVPQARKKRNKCTPEQSNQLEAFFANNRNPTGRIREELSRRIQMPERSVQVWFQNKRAKTKITEIREGVPLEQRTTVSRERFTRPINDQPREVVMNKKRRNTHDGGINREDSALITLPSSSLCIGEWRRIKPLICLFSQRNQSFTWYLSSESVGFKLECPIGSVTKITFTGPTEPSVDEYGEGVMDLQGQLTLDLSRPPQFYMEVFRSSAKAHEMEKGGHKAAWRQCTDFTEGRQATSTLQHIVSGSYDDLRQAVMQLYEASGSVSTLIEVQDVNLNQIIEQPIQTYDFSTSTSGFFSPSSQQLNFGDLDGQNTFFQHQSQSQSQDQGQGQGQAQTQRQGDLDALQSSRQGSVVSNTALNFTGLRLRQDSVSVNQQQQQQQEQRVNPSVDLQAYSWTNPIQMQPMIQRQESTDPLAVSWNMTDPLFGINTTPAFEVQSFTKKQNQQQQYQRAASMGNIYSSLSSIENGDFYPNQSATTSDVNSTFRD